MDDGRSKMRVKWRFPRTGKWGSPFLVLLCLLPACSTFSAQYFIEVVETRPNFTEPHSSFIRLDLSGYAVLTRSKFEKGWYDRDAVDSLFSTVVSKVATGVSGSQSDGPGEGSGGGQPETAAASRGPSQRQGSGGGSADRVDRTFRVFGPGGEEPKAENKRLVIFATANPDDLVNQILTTVRTQELSSQIANLLLAPQLREAQAVTDGLAIAAKRHETILGEVGQLLSWLESADPLQAEALRRELNKLVRTIESVRETGRAR